MCFAGTTASTIRLLLKIGIRRFAGMRWIIFSGISAAIYLEYSEISMRHAQRPVILWMMGLFLLSGNQSAIFFNQFLAFLLFILYS